MQNTKIHYMYRDAGNWKFFGDFIVSGAVGENELTPYLFDNEFFIPHEVGLKHLLAAPVNGDDHYLHTFESFEPTDEQPSLCSAQELVDRFKTAAKKGWFSSLV
ncbi:MAG: hypothetical protein R3D32_02675 [Nitratireductor sp.]